MFFFRIQIFRVFGSYDNGRGGAERRTMEEGLHDEKEKNHHGRAVYRVPAMYGGMERQFVQCGGKLRA